jgi:hypothetical protein
VINYPKPEMSEKQQVLSHSGALPLVVAVTGHRDLVASETTALRQKVREFFLDLAERYPSRRLRLLSPLAEGADQLVAEVAVDLDIELVVPLPMDESDYMKDFSSRRHIENYEWLKSRASDAYVLEISLDQSNGTGLSGWSPQERAYAQLGVFLAAHCHILLAIWDGKESDNPGGTGHVVRFHHDNVLPGLVPNLVTTQQMLVDDESDLVYHVVCSRDRPDGRPRPGLTALDGFWFTKNIDEPRSARLPVQHDTIFRRSEEFSMDAMRYAADIDRERQSLLDPAWTDQLPPGIEAIDRLQSTADWLAVRYQRLILLAFRLLHILAFAMGLTFILYSDLRTWPGFLAAFLLAFVCAIGIQYLSKQRGWHRKYLDYRALAEGLRVQFYWAVAGVSQPNASSFTHDSFLQAQDPEIGWIRNVMRVAGTRIDASRRRSQFGLDVAVREWIGSADSGQLGYFRSRTRTKNARKKLTERLGRACLAASAGVAAVFLFASSYVPDNLHGPLMIALGLLLLMFAVRHSYASSIAEEELIKQYEFMLRVFDDAHSRVPMANDAAEKRQVLYALGHTALDEQAQWLLTHRERSIESTDILQMGG